MSAIDDVLEERWEVEMGDLLTIYDLSREWDDPDVRVCVCDHSIVKGSREHAQARAAVASQAPEMARLLIAIVEKWGEGPGHGPLYDAVKQARALLASIREAAGD